MTAPKNKSSIEHVHQLSRTIFEGCVPFVQQFPSLIGFRMAIGALMEALTSMWLSTWASYERSGKLPELEKFRAYVLESLEQIRKVVASPTPIQEAETFGKASDVTDVMTGKIHG